MGSRTDQTANESACANATAIAKPQLPLYGGNFGLIAGENIDLQHIIGFLATLHKAVAALFQSGYELIFQGKAAVAGITHLQKDALIGRVKFQKNRLAHLGLHIKIFLGQCQLSGTAADKTGTQKNKQHAS